MALIKSTDLDFDTIKANLKTYLQQKSEFADYNFEAGGLSNILDVLAYNTHVNGLVANMAINESFLGSAQLRSSVVSHAETLGYYPRSMTGSSANVSMTITTTDTTSGSITLPAYTKFTTNLNDVTYTFQTQEDYIADNDGTGTYKIKTTAGSNTIPIKEGVVKTKTFLVGDTTDNQVYVIPDETVDTSTIKVKVYDTTTSSSFTSYADIQNSVRIDSNSTVYIVREVPNGYFELTFSDGNVLGKSPTAGNKIEVTYLSVKGADANLADSFSPNSQVSIGGQNYDMTVAVIDKSSGGSSKETIESIKSNAPIAFASQQRLVTAEDYKALILQRYSSVLDDAIAWGGNDNIPATYGKVYIALKFKTGISSADQTTTKNSISSQLTSNLGIMSIDTVFSDPVTSYLEVTTSFNFDPDLTGNTAETTQSQVLTTMTNFFTNNLNKFNATFRRSKLIAEIDALSPAILNSSIAVKVQQRLSVTTGSNLSYDVNFPVALATPDDINYTITTSRFTQDGVTCDIRNKLETNKLQVINTNTLAIVQDNVGTYDTGKGTVNLVGFNPSAIEGTTLNISATPADQSTIRPLRNYIFTLDAQKSTAVATIDFQNTAVTLST